MAESDSEGTSRRSWLWWFILPGTITILMTIAVYWAQSRNSDLDLVRWLEAIGYASGVSVFFGLWQYARDVRDREQELQESTEALSKLTTRMEDRFSSLTYEMQTSLSDLGSALKNAQDLTTDVRSLSKTVEELRGTLESSAQLHEDETVLRALPGTLEDIWSKTRIDVPLLYGVLERVAVRNDTTDVYERRVDVGGADSA